MYAKKEAIAEDTDHENDHTQTQNAFGELKIAHNASGELSIQEPSCVTCY